MQQQFDTQEMTPKQTMTPHIEMKEMCIVISNKSNMVVSISVNTLTHILHLIVALSLINDLHTKLVDYTIDDYCVIMIGY